MEHIIANLLQNFEQGKMSRRQLIQGMALAVTAASAVGAAPSAAAAGSPIKAVSIHHISWDVKDHIKCRDFYSDLFGMRVFEGTIAKQAHLQIGPTYLTFRGPGAREVAPPTTPYVDHIAIGVEPWPGPDMDDVNGAPVVAAELRRRGFKLNPKGEIKIKDPEGFIVQICGAVWKTDR